MLSKSELRNSVSKLALSAIMMVPGLVSNPLAAQDNRGWHGRPPAIYGGSGNSFSMSVTSQHDRPTGGEKYTTTTSMHVPLLPPVMPYKRYHIFGSNKGAQSEVYYRTHYGRDRYGRDYYRDFYRDYYRDNDLVVVLDNAPVYQTAPVPAQDRYNVDVIFTKNSYVIAERDNKKETITFKDSAYLENEQSELSEKKAKMEARSGKRYDISDYNEVCDNLSRINGEMSKLNEVMQRQVVPARPASKNPAPTPAPAP